MSIYPRIRKRSKGNRTKYVDWNEAKTIPILELARYLGIRFDNHGKAQCPFPDHEDSTPSFQFYEETNSFHCFGCNRGGSPIQLIAHIRIIDNYNAALWLIETLGRGLSPTNYLPPKKLLKSRPKKILNEEQQKGDAEVYSWLLSRSPLLSTGQNFLRERGFSKQTISKFRIGQLKPTNEVFSEAIDIWGFERVKRSGLLTKKATTKSPTALFRTSYILFPFFRNGICEYMQARACGQGTPRWLALAGIKKPLYNIDVLLDRSTDKAVWVCEGITDVLSATELGIQAVGVLGATSFSKEFADYFRGRDVHVIPDCDRAGKTMGRKLQKIFTQYGVNSIVQKLPYGKDVNEYLLINQGNK
jgi:DNA primase